MKRTFLTAPPLDCVVIPGAREGNGRESGFKQVYSIATIGHARWFGLSAYIPRVPAGTAFPTHAR